MFYSHYSSASDDPCSSRVGRSRESCGGQYRGEKKTAVEILASRQNNICFTCMDYKVGDNRVVPVDGMQEQIVV